MGLLATLATLQLLPLWQLCLLGIVTFWCGLWLMAIKWAGVAPAHLGLSRVTPMLTVCLEVMCTGEAARGCRLPQVDMKDVAVGVWAHLSWLCTRPYACLEQPSRQHAQVGVLTGALCWPAGAFIIQVLPVMWLGRSLLCMALLVSSLGMMGMHLTAYLQDPGYTPLPDAGEVPAF
jgi:hypothetical protein